MITKELKVYEKHGGDFLWGKTQERAYAVRSRLAADEYAKNIGAPPSADDADELNSMIKRL